MQALVLKHGIPAMPALTHPFRLSLSKPGYCLCKPFDKLRANGWG